MAPEVPSELDYIYIGILMGILIDIFPIQYINESSFRETSIGLIIVLFMFFGLSSIKYDFYVPKVKYLIRGISYGSFFMASKHVFTWIFGSWELISSTFSIIMSLYFSSLFLIFDSIYEFVSTHE